LLTLETEIAAIHGGEIVGIISGMVRRKKGPDLGRDLSLFKRL